MRKITVLHLVNNVGPSSIPLEVAECINNRTFEVILISFFDTNKDLEIIKKNSNIKIVGIGAKNLIDIMAFIRLYQAIKKFNPDILHVHHNFSGSLGRIFGKLINMPYIIDTEHSDHKGFKFFGCLVNGLTLNLSDLIICNSYNTMNSFYRWENWLIAQNKKIVIYNGTNIKKIDTNRDEPIQTRKILNIHPSTFLIGNVGMMKKQKDQKTLIIAMKEIIRKAPDTKLVIVGDGKLRHLLENLVQKYGVKKHIVFTGLINRDKVYRIIHTVDVFTMVSLWEGFCNAIIEAMAACKPVVVTDINVFYEVVGDAGKYVPTSNPLALAKTILELRNNPLLRNTLGIAGRKRVENKFSLEKTVSAYENLYIKLIDSKKVVNL